MPGEVCNLDRRFLRRVFPGFRLVGAIRMAFDLRKLIIAALGLALLQLGWSMLDRLFPASAAVTPDSLTAGAADGPRLRRRIVGVSQFPAGSRAAVGAVPGSAFAALGSVRSARVIGRPCCMRSWRCRGCSWSGESAAARSAGSRWFGLPACSRRASARRSVFRCRNARLTDSGAFHSVRRSGVLRRDPRGVWSSLPAARGRRRAGRRALRRFRWAWA